MSSVLCSIPRSGVGSPSVLFSVYFTFQSFVGSLFGVWTVGVGQGRVTYYDSFIPSLSTPDLGRRKVRLYRVPSLPFHTTVSSGDDYLASITSALQSGDPVLPFSPVGLSPTLDLFRVVLLVPLSLRPGS